MIDDETYVPIDPLDVPGQDYYTTNDKENLPIAHKIKPKAKFSRRYLVLQAIDESGNVSDPFITNKTLTGEIYKQKCLKELLLPFIQKNVGKNGLFYYFFIYTSICPNRIVHLRL